MRHRHRGLASRARTAQEPLAALTNGYQSAFAVAIAFAVLGLVLASTLLGKRREPTAVAEAEAAVA